MTWRPLPTPSAEREPRRVADSLERIAARLGAPKPSLLSAVFVRWTDLVGPDVAAHATPRMLRDGVLTVVVDHPAWATSLRLLGADLLRRIGDVVEVPAAEPPGGAGPGGAGPGGAGPGGGARGRGALRPGAVVTELVVQVDAGPRRGRPPAARGDGGASPRRPG